MSPRDKSGFSVISTDILLQVRLIHLHRKRTRPYETSETKATDAVTEIQRQPIVDGSADIDDSPRFSVLMSLEKLLLQYEIFSFEVDFE